jgi:hypothetical protein
VLGICRVRESLYNVKVVIIITEDIHASSYSISLTHIVFKILQLQVRKLGCMRMWVGQGLAWLHSRLWLLQLLGLGWLGQRETVAAVTGKSHNGIKRV